MIYLIKWHEKWEARERETTAVAAARGKLAAALAGSEVVSSDYGLRRRAFWILICSLYAPFWRRRVWPLFLSLFSFGLRAPVEDDPRTHTLAPAHQIMSPLAFESMLI
jgi:hypothetical protein